MSRSSSSLSWLTLPTLALLIIAIPFAAPQRVWAAPHERSMLDTIRAYANGTLNPPGPIDASTATTDFVVHADDFAVGDVVSKVTIDITFSKVGGGTCPGPGGGRDWAEEIRFRLFAPDGTMVPLVRYNDYQSSDPDVGQVTVTFDDSGASTVAGLPIQNGTFRPSSGAMADFNGLEPAANGGVWTLQLSDQWLDDPLCFASATLHITAIAPPDLSVQQTDNPDPVIAGQDLFYTIAVRNDGSDTVAGVVMTDTLPLPITYMDDTGGCTFHAGTGPGGTDQLICPLPDIAPASSRSVQIRTHVPADAVATQADGILVLSNVASASSTYPDSTPGNNTLTEITYVRDQADLHVTKLSLPGATVQAGELFTYTIYVDNLGQSHARSVALSDEILSSGTFELVSLLEDPNRADGCNLAPSGLDIHCTLDDPLETGGRWVIQLALRASEAQTVDNLVQVTSATPDPFLSNNQAVSFVSITSAANLFLSKAAVGQTQRDGQPGGVFTDTVDAVTAGSTLTYTLVALNSGPSTAENVLVRDLLPDWITIVDVATTQGQCNRGIPGNPGVPQLCYLGSLAPGSSATMTVIADVWTSVPSGTVLYNEAIVSSDTFDPDNTDDMIANDTVVSAWADLTLTTTTLVDVVTAGDPLTYTLLVSNRGPSNADNTIVLNDLPISTTIVGATTTQGQCSQDDPQQCSLGLLPPGSSATVTVVADVWTSVLSGTVLYDEAVVGSDIPDPDDNNNLTITTTCRKETENLPPTGNAGENQVVSLGALVTLDGSGSSDPEGDALSYFWEQTGGTTVILSDPTAMQPTFTAPDVPVVLTFSLTVTDSGGLSAQDTVTVTVQPYQVYLPLVLRR